MTTIAVLEFFNRWWDVLSLPQQVFYGIGLLAGAVTMILALMSMVGLEHHDVVDAAGAMDFDNGGGGIFSVKPLTGFFLGFGWGGGLMIDAGFGLPLALVTGLVGGGAIMAMVVFFFRSIYSLRSDGTVRMSEAVGAVGTVYVTVPAGRVAGGQVIVTFSGRQETVSALSAAERPLAGGEKVRVTALIDSRTVQVEPLA